MLYDHVTGPAAGRVAAGQPVPESRLRRLFSAIRDRLLTWGERERERQWLADFNDHMLKDIGMTRGEMRHEVNKPFWKS
ncbi:DUF1127 domain-containing protein [Azospirillum sp. RWY-5-1]|uniref:DUF1127 domain-containing protein n=1 Tax=Azospirillum oleiclasticum TaxID=2735135 RepID=A0ABX2TIQ4_9PROT|nr:DUF1127 domain-containing protein [Azospirillum oleiclasticum]NYZ17087.1 DUF1127 domain-containing protein [Azospirillum oleiclasticum]NYZ24225.1 DUF1127 domain-containing protein [Azospirillum oleiclasticum]